MQHKRVKPQLPYRGQGRRAVQLSFSSPRSLDRAGREWECLRAARGMVLGSGSRRVSFARLALHFCAAFFGSPAAVLHSHCDLVGAAGAVLVGAFLHPFCTGEFPLPGCDVDVVLIAVKPKLRSL